MSGQHTGLSDIALLAEGEDHARLLGRRLGGRRFAEVFSSTLTRAVQTAVLAGYPPTNTTPLLVEVDYGSYDGVTSEEIRRTRPHWDLWRDGCPGGEAIPRVLERAREFLDLAGRVDADVIAFSHGHFIKALVCVALDLPIEAASRLSLGTAALSALHLDSRGPMLELWNDTGHLPDHSSESGSDSLNSAPPGTAGGRSTPPEAPTTC